MGWCDEINGECNSEASSCEECLFESNNKSTYQELVEALKYAHRFALRNDMYDKKYIQEIIERCK